MLTKEQRTKVIKKTKDFLLMFFIQVLSYGLICFNWRAVAKGDYVLIGVSDFIFASMTFFVIRKIAKDDNGDFFLWLGYTTGSLVGSLIGVWISKTYFNL